METVTVVIRSTCDAIDAIDVEEHLGVFSNMMTVRRTFQGNWIQEFTDDDDWPVIECWVLEEHARDLVYSRVVASTFEVQS